MNLPHLALRRRRRHHRGDKAQVLMDDKKNDKTSNLCPAFGTVAAFVINNARSLRLATNGRDPASRQHF